MDISKLKEKLDGATFAELETFVTDLTGQRDTARRESIDGRKGLKDKVAALEAAQATLLQKLGVDSIEDVESLPDAKGSAEAARQYEAKVRRLERDLADAAKARDEIGGKFRESLQRAAIAEALAGHDFVARDVVENYIGGRLAWEGEEMFFRADDGKLMPIKDGVAGFAKTRPELLKSSSAGGAGFRPANARGGAGTTKNPYAAATFNLTEQVALAKENPELAAQLKAAAQSA